MNNNGSNTALMVITLGATHTILLSVPRVIPGLLEAADIHQWRDELAEAAEVLQRGIRAVDNHLEWLASQGIAWREKRGLPPE